MENLIGFLLACIGEYFIIRIALINHEQMMERKIIKDEREQNEK